VTEHRWKSVTDPRIVAVLTCAIVREQRHREANRLRAAALYDETTREIGRRTRGWLYSNLSEMPATMADGELEREAFFPPHLSQAGRKNCWARMTIPPSILRSVNRALPTARSKDPSQPWPFYYSQQRLADFISQTSDGLAQLPHIYVSDRGASATPNVFAMRQSIPQ